MGARLSDDALAFVSVDLVHVAHDGDVDVVKSGVRPAASSRNSPVPFLLARDQHVAFEDPQGAFTRLVSRVLFLVGPGRVERGCTRPPKLICGFVCTRAWSARI